jgi:hypothetical protein
MSTAVADSPTIPPADNFVIGEPAGRLETLLLPLARLTDLLDHGNDDRPPLAGTIAKLATITAGIGIGIAALTLGLLRYGIALLR